MVLVNCCVSLGELLDKISILRIKSVKIGDKKKKDYAVMEEQELMKVLEELNLKGVESYLERLVEINNKLWDIEDQIRAMEAEGRFDDEFIQLARAVYISNDKRFEIKSELNNHFGSSIKEVKSYKKY